MELRDIIFLIIAIAAWIYSNFRKLQNEAAKRAKKLAEQPSKPTVTEPVLKTVTQQRETAKPLAKKTFLHKDKPAYTLEDHSIANAETEVDKVRDFWENEMKSSGILSEKKYIEADFAQKTGDSIADEIRSGKVNWKRAIILSEIIRPVYFK